MSVQIMLFSCLLLTPIVCSYMYIHVDERDGHVNYYNEFIVHDDLSWYPLSLMEFGMNNLKANWSLKTVGHQALKVSML